ncbi:uncharacterized protein LOC126389941 isoform X2 [Epinephelus moara]|uniref:uncharacterized protein LOC126389941 isoform X2 n=1 Tax=Epinephelus moara TaxID=300413 RepID=UPI00214EB19F|nr:uncharacterized protein LOC126389941 isoform X2 [Epinephelus moara]
MSVELQHASEPGGNNASLQGTMLGGSKPLHRFMQGQPKITGYLVCGSLYIVTENKPTKKTVTMSLALSIVSLLASCWIIFLYLPNIIHNLQRVHLDEDIMVATDNDIFPSEYEHLEMASEQIFLLYTGVGGIIFIVMSFLAGAALRSTKSKAVVVMTATPAEPSVE